MNDAARIYASHFTEPELKQLLTFYQSPLGRKVIAEEPAAANESMAMAGSWADKLSEEVINKMRAEMKILKRTLDSQRNAPAQGPAASGSAPTLPPPLPKAPVRGGLRPYAIAAAGMAQPVRGRGRLDHQGIQLLLGYRKGDRPLGRPGRAVAAGRLARHRDRLGTRPLGLGQRFCDRGGLALRRLGIRCAWVGRRCPHHRPCQHGVDRRRG